MFNWLRPVAQIANELRRIADVLEYFAVQDARSKNVMFVPKKKGWHLPTKDESELMHTDHEYIQRMRDEEQQLLAQRGYPALEEQDSVDE